MHKKMNDQLHATSQSTSQATSESVRKRRFNTRLAYSLASFFAIVVLLISSNLVFAQDATSTNRLFLPIVSSGNAQASATDEPLRPESYDSQQEPVLDESANAQRTFCFTFIKFTNLSSSKVNVYWVNSFGGESLYKTLSPNTYYWQQTFYGHRWRVRSTSGALLYSLTANSCFFIYVNITNSSFPTATPLPPTATATKTPVPPTATATKTPVPPTATPTSTPLPATATATPTNTPVTSLFASIGNQVWFDLNGNGNQEIDEPYVLGVTVELLQGCASSVILGTQVTDGNGFYNFTNLAPSQYRVRFSTLPLGYQFTGKDVGLSESTDSDVNVDGTTDCRTVAPGEENMFVDAGIVTVGAPTPTPTNTPVSVVPASIGNQVWFDLNANGTQEIDEPYVPGVTVQLLQSCVGETVLETQVSDGNGFYTFANLTPTQYRVRFSNIPAGYQFTIKDVGLADNIDSDVNPDGTTDCLTVASGENDAFEDAGIVALP
jgi:cell division septation protein DedD